MDDRFVTLLRPFLRFLPAERTPQPGDRLHELGLDSMQAIELLFAVEDTFGVTLPDEKLTDATFETAGSLWAAIMETVPETVPETAPATPLEPVPATVPPTALETLSETAGSWL